MQTHTTNGPPQARIRNRIPGLRLPGACVTALAFTILSHAAEDSVQNRSAITISPLHLLNPVLHLTDELRLARKIGVAVMVGAGAVSEEGRYYGTWEIGGQFRWYPLVSFTHGMMLGTDTGYIDVLGDLEDPMAYCVGMRAGVLVGYKLALRAGFTMEVQIGPQYVWEDVDNAGLQTLPGLRVGWSL